MIEQDMAIIYKYAKQIYLKELRQVDAITQIQPQLVEWDFNENSFIDFCAALRHMLNGTRHTRGISTDLREFYLGKIYEDFGIQRLKNLLTIILFCARIIFGGCRKRLLFLFFLHSFSVLQYVVRTPVNAAIVRFYRSFLPRNLPS